MSVQPPVASLKGTYMLLRETTMWVGALPSNTVPNPREDVKVITTRSGIVLAGPSVPPPHLSSSKEVERDPETTMDQMFKKLHFNISLVEALALMPKYAKILKDLLTNKEKLLEMANTPLNENCSADIFKKLPEKLGDPRKFLIHCDFIDVNTELRTQCVCVLELANRSVAYPTDIAEDVFVQVGGPLLWSLSRGEKLILRVGEEKLTFKVDITSKYSLKYGKKSINMIDIFDTTCEDHFYEVLKLQILIHPLSGNPNPSSDLVVASLSPSLTPFGDSEFLLEEIDTFLSHFDHSLPDYEAFCFDIDHQEEKSSGSTTSQSDHSLPDYEVFCFDIDPHEEKSSGGTISHSDHSLLEYESFYFDLSIDPPPIVERSNSYLEEFADELAHIISLPEYDHFYFDIKADLGELTRILRENISSRIKDDKELKSKTSTKKLTTNELNDLRLLLSNCDSTFSEKFSEIDPLVSFPFGNKDKNFDHGILNGVYSKRSYILSLNAFYPISFVSDLLFLSDPSEIETFLSFPSGYEDKVFNPGILIIYGIHSFMRKFLRLPNDNFKIDKRDIFSEISLKIKSLICFHLKDKEIQGESS
ncbi:hypothetical protein Tco_0723454 [Tanacetum coccineum]